MMGLVPSKFRRDTRELAPCLTPRPACEDTVRKKPDPSQEKSPRRGTESDSALTLAFPASKTVGNKSLVFKPPTLRYFVKAAQAD